MYFQTLSHAGLRVVAGETELLCDPWLIGSTYWRSWWNYPPVPRDLVASLKPDYIYLTHLHWDHFQAASLRLFSPDTPVIVPYDRYGRMVRDLEQIGMTNVRELRHGQRIELGPDLALTSYHTGPFILDSAPMIEAQGVTLWNANDAKFAGPPLAHILRRHPRIDFCFRSHSSANPRTCYHEIGEAGARQFEEDNERYARVFSLFMAAVRPRYAIPFASNNCLLHDDAFHLNDLAQTPPMVAAHFARFARRRGLETELQMMGPGDLWDSADGFVTGDDEWFENRAARLEQYRSRVAPTMARQAELEARVSVSLKSVQRFFQRLSKDVPRLLTARLKGRPVLLVAKAGEQRTGFAVDLYAGEVRAVTADEFGRFPARIEIPAIILRQSMAMNMFGHAGISKRVKYFATNDAMPILRRFVTILELAEAEIFPLRANLTARALRALLPRWREALLHAGVLIDIIRGRDLLEVEECYLERQSRASANRGRRAPADRRNLPEASPQRPAQSADLRLR